MASTMFVFTFPALGYGNKRFSIQAGRIFPSKFFNCTCKYYFLAQLFLCIVEFEH